MSALTPPKHSEVAWGTVLISRDCSPILHLSVTLLEGVLFDLSEAAM